MFLFSKAWITNTNIIIMKAIKLSIQYGQKVVEVEEIEREFQSVVKIKSI
jgi:hypothetical protein